MISGSSLSGTARAYVHFLNESMKVKICGIRTLEEAHEVVLAGADALGFLVDVGEAKCAVGLATAATIVAKMPPFVSTVAVSTSMDPKQIIRIAKSTGASTLQLQGAVSADAIRAVKAIFLNTRFLRYQSLV